MLLFCFRSKKVVQLRNEVIESLEMDRRREAEEDQVSIIRSGFQIRKDPRLI